MAFTVLLKAGLEGVKNRETLIPAVEDNLYHLTQNQILSKNIDF